MLGFMPLSFPPRKRGPRSRDGAAATARTSAQRAFCQHDAQALLKKQHPPCHGGHSGLMSFWLPSRARRSLGPGVRRENENNPPPCCPLRLDRKSTRLNSSHVAISYGVFCFNNIRRQEQT